MPQTNEGNENNEIEVEAPTLAYPQLPTNNNDFYENDNNFRENNRRSMSMLNPYEQADLNAYMKDQEKMKEMMFLPDDKQPKRTVMTNEFFFEDRPTNTIFLETSKEQDERVRKNSPFGHLKTWRLIKIIVKSNDDVRQEQFAMQLISQIDQIFKIKNLKLWLKPYEILATGARCGLIEVVSDALSINSIKRKVGVNSKLVDYFHQ